MKPIAHHLQCRLAARTCAHTRTASLRQANTPTSWAILVRDAFSLGLTESVNNAHMREVASRELPGPSPEMLRFGGGYSEAAVVAVTGGASAAASRPRPANCRSIQCSSWTEDAAGGGAGSGFGETRMGADQSAPPPPNRTQTPTQLQRRMQQRNQITVEAAGNSTVHRHWGRFRTARAQRQLLR